MKVETPDPATPVSAPRPITLMIGLGAIVVMAMLAVVALHPDAKGPMAASEPGAAETGGTPQNPPQR